MLPSLRTRAAAKALVLCLLGCASAKPGAQPSTDAAGKDVVAPTDTAGVGDTPNDTTATNDAAAANDAAVTNDASVTNDVPT